LSAISIISTGPFPSGSTIVYTGNLVDLAGLAIPAASLSTLTLSLLNGAGAVINSVSNVNILNTGRGTVDTQGKVTVTLSPADTALGTFPSVRSSEIALVLNWTSGGVTGRHQANLTLVALSG
jgi:hypothetical protein